MAAFDGDPDFIGDVYLMENDRQRELFEARVLDAMEKCEKGAVACLPFLTPGERKRAMRTLCAAGMQACAWTYGGYRDAERACLFLLPEYLLDCLSLPLCECAAEEVCALLGEEATEAVCALKIRGSGFRTLSHRDYLGSILGLGIARDAIGDIAVQNESCAVVFCPSALAKFLLTSLERVGNDAVRVSLYTPDESFTDGRRYQPMSDTVASARLDCVVAALCNLSREAAQDAVRTGLVEVDFEPAERTDLCLEPPVTISVRGYGRFILRSFDGETRKGRLRLRADKLI